MFKRPTVFLLGAGASWHYGYPTGEDLVRQCIIKAEKLSVFFHEGYKANFSPIPSYCTRAGNSAQGNMPWEIAAKEAISLKERLSSVNPTLIDYFLAQNDDLHDIGRLVIALVIFDCEWQFFGFKGNSNRRILHDLEVARGNIQRSPYPNLSAFNDDWLRFVLYQMTTGCKKSSDLLENKVSFVSFNYDTSLEHRLFDGLRSISRFEPPDINAFLWDGRFFHVYGALRERIDSGWSALDPKLSNLSNVSEFQGSIDLVNKAYAASLGIQTIDGDDKLKNKDTIDKARAAIDRAEVVYILGYGFDQQNSERLGLHCLNSKKAPSRHVYFTNYRGLDRVSMSAGGALVGWDDTFLDKAIYRDRSTIDSVEHQYRYQMSRKNVYDALAEDFDSLETG